MQVKHSMFVQHSSLKILIKSIWSIPPRVLDTVSQLLTLVVSSRHLYSKGSPHFSLVQSFSFSMGCVIVSQSCFFVKDTI